MSLPGGNQVDGLPPACNLLQVRGRRVEIIQMGTVDCLELAFNIGYERIWFSEIKNLVH